MFTSRAITIAATAALATLSGAQPLPFANVSTPKMWPVSHMHTETMFVTGLSDVQTKPVYYNFPQSQYRADLINLNGVNFKNQSSYWLGNLLYLYTFDVGFCVLLDMGFGMMKPDWFLNGQIIGGVWRAHKSEEFDSSYHYTTWTSVSAGDQGQFDYFSRNDTGTAYTMSAPSPEGLVVNEYSEFSVVDYTATTVFDLPAGITCINGTGSPLRTITKYAKHILGDVLLGASQAGVKLV